MKKYKDLGIYDFSDYAEEITGDDLFKVNGGAQVANTNQGVANAHVGDTVTRNDGTTVTITQGDINWAQQQIDSSGSSGNNAQQQGPGSSGSGNGPSGPTAPDIPDEIKSNPDAYNYYMSLQGKAKEEGDPDKYKGYSVLGAGKVNLKNIAIKSLSEKEQYFSSINCNKFEINMLVPEDVEINDNISMAKNMSIYEFYKTVKNKGKWDYKQIDGKYEDFGNFNFGVTGRAMGFPREVLLRGAGFASVSADPKRKEDFGNWYGKAPYGDDPKDQFFIQKGMDYYEKNY